MSRVFLSLLLGCLVVMGLIVFQATRGSASTVLLPSDLAAHPADQALSRIRVAGKVSEVVSYDVQPEFVLRFKINNPGTGSGEAVPVVFHGIKPDMFATGRDVILDGEFKEGVFLAEKLLTQCPSKYEAPSPETQYKPR